jgi:hypothetical protein
LLSFFRLISVIDKNTYDEKDGQRIISDPFWNSTLSFVISVRSVYQLIVGSHVAFFGSAASYGAVDFDKSFRNY